MLPGLLRFANGIEIGEEVVLMTTKGEADARSWDGGSEGEDEYRLGRRDPYTRTRTRTRARTLTPTRARTLTRTPTLS